MHCCDPSVLAGRAIALKLTNGILAVIKCDLAAAMQRKARAV